MTAPSAGGVPPSAAPPGFAYGLTLPGGPGSAGVARAVVRSVLRAHGLDRHAPPAQLAVTELIATAVRLGPGEDVHLFLRHREGALRLLLWDQHPRHRDPGDEGRCVERRRRSLWLLAAVVDDWGGKWGTVEARPPHRGTKSWVVLPR
ncbi:ATP-binding protein [Streptomyces sp. NPDC058872]|uniref:ATP-binding protein n=1 Tax=Streptomyces sp. NPDC058872 TaxID=3346661 RepID=UPI0036923F42